MGYPAGWLTALAKRLPGLRSVVVYSQLFAGITKESQEDAVGFFKALPGLRAVHLLDVFAKERFFRDAGKWLRYNTSETPGEARRGLMFLEVNYTFRHEDEDFMHKIQATELPDLIGPGLISCSFNIATPENAEDDPDDPANLQEAGNKQGVMAFNKSVAADQVIALTEEDNSPKGLRALNLTLYTLTLKDLKKVLEVQKHVMVLNVTLEVEPGEEWKKGLLEALALCKGLEQVEVVANPTLQFFMEVCLLLHLHQPSSASSVCNDVVCAPANPHSVSDTSSNCANMIIQVQNPRHGTMAKTFPSAEDMQSWSSKAEKLSAFSVSILRAPSFGTVDWAKKDGKWVGGVSEGKGVPAGPS